MKLEIRHVTTIDVLHASKGTLTIILSSTGLVDFRRAMTNRDGGRKRGQDRERMCLWVSV